MKKRIVVHIHDGRADTKDASTPADFNTGLRINVIAKVQAAKLPTKPASADLSNSREYLNRAKSDIDGLLAILRGLGNTAKDAAWTTYDPREAARIDGKIKELEKELQLLKQERSKYRDGA